MSVPSNCIASGLTYRDLEHKLLAVVVRLDGVQNSGQLSAIEFDCEFISSCPAENDRFCESQKTVVGYFMRLTVDNGTDDLFCCG